MFVSCQECKGMGFQSDRSRPVGQPKFNRCPACQGTRGFDITRGHDICPKCNGKKKFYRNNLIITCNKCNGKGHVKKQNWIIARIAR